MAALSAFATVRGGYVQLDGITVANVGNAAGACSVQRIIDVHSVRQNELRGDLAVQGRIRRGKNVRNDAALVIK